MTYFIAVAALLMTSRWGVGATVAVSPPTTLYDLGAELFVAHHLVLERQAMDAAAIAGGVPGLTQGPASSEGVGPVSISYDNGQVTYEGAGPWNATMYGLRWMRLARSISAGPLQVGVGWVPQYLVTTTGPGWAGPGVPWPGWTW